MTTGEDIRSVPGTAPSGIRVLLVDDQTMVGEAVRRILLSAADVEYCYCGEPTKAIEVAAAFAPTVILQDLVMPDVDGLMMLRFYKANPDTRDVPVVVLSTKEEPKVKAEAFTLGATDYLVKLPDPIELVARVRHHSRAYTAQRERNEAYAALQRSEARLAEELAQAAKYVASLLPDRLNGAVSTDWQFVPSVELGGDAFGYHWVDDEHFSMYLLDVCGHGLKSALLSISAMNVVRNQALQGTDFRSPASVLASLNDLFQMDRHDDMYFTMWYGVVNARTRTLRYASGGHPPAVLLHGASAGEATVTMLGAPGMIIGGLPGTRYTEMECVLDPFSRIFVFSDGIYEIARPERPMMTLGEFVEIVRAAPRGPGASAHIVEAVRAERGRPDFEDDVSVVEVTL